VAWSRTAVPADYARLVPRILDAAPADSGAAAVLAEADAAIVGAIDRLMAEGPLPLCFLGGLGRAFAARLGPRYPGLIREPRGTGLDGALALAREPG
jgi:glucosamine kinase